MIMNISKKELNKNFFYNLLYEIVIILSPLIITPYISRRLGVELVGVRSYTYAILMYFELFSTLGITIYGQREIARVKNNEEERSKIFLSLMAIKILFFTVVLLVYSLTFFKFNVLGEYKLIWFIWLLHLFETLFNVTWFFQGIEKFKYISIRGIILRTVQIILTLVFVKTKKDFYIYLILYSGIPLLQAITLWPFLKSSVNLKYIKSINLKKHIKPILIFFIPTISTTIYSNVDKIMLGSLLKSTVQTGYYDSAQSIALLATTIFTSIYTVMRSRSSFEVATNNQDNIDYFIRIALFMIFPVSLGIFGISNEFILIFFGKAFAPVSLLLKTFCAVIVLIGLSGFISSVYIVPNDKQNNLSYFYILSTILNVVLNYFLISKYGAMGAIISSIIAELLVCVGCLVLSRKVISLKKMFMIGWKYVAASILMLFVITIYSKYTSPSFTDLVLEIMFGALTYIIFLLILKDKFMIEVIEYLQRSIFRKGEKKMKKIFIFGWFGENNLGDDALLNQTIDTIYKINKNCKCTLATNNKSNIIINNKNNDMISCVSKSFKSLFFSLSKNNIYIFGPGGLFPNKDLKKLVYIYAYILLLKLLRKKVIILGVGIENCNFESKLNRLIIKKIIGLADKCTLRYNPMNYEIQKKATRKAIRAADIMFLHKYNKKECKNRKLVCFALANIFSNDNDRENFIYNLKPTIDKLISDGFKIEFLTFTDKKDYELNKLVVEKLKLQKKDYNILNFTRNLDEVLDKIKKSEFVIGMRFHSIVFSCNLCKPFISISYSSKNEELLNDFELNEYSTRCCYSLDKYFCKKIPLNGDDLLSKYDLLIDNRENMHDKFSKNLKNEIKLAQINEKILKEIL